MWGTVITWSVLISDLGDFLQKKEKNLNYSCATKPDWNGVCFLSDSALGAPAICFLRYIVYKSVPQAIILCCFNRTLFVTRAHTKHLRLDTFWREKVLNGNYRSIHLLQEGASENTYEADCDIETLKKGTFWEGLLTEKDLH
jgi:hypothetical protein